MRLKLFCIAFSIITMYSCVKESVAENSNILETSLENPVSVEYNFNVENTINWVTNIQNYNGLLPSSENTAYVSLYDNALAAIAFIKLDKLEKAEQIFDFFNSKINEELLANKGGFFQLRDLGGNNGQRTWMGDNAWLLIALNHYQAKTNSSKYNTLAFELEKWIRSLQLENGSIAGGYNEDGTPISIVTEGIITAFNAVPGYDDFHKNILYFLKTERWNGTEKALLAWPENPSYEYALDLHSLGFNIFEDFPTQTLDNASRYITTQTSTMNGEIIMGYAFDEDKDVVWLEGTAQMAVAYNSASLKTQSDSLLKEIEKSILESTTYTNAHGLPYVTNHGSSYGVQMLWDDADLTPAISSSIWYIFAKLSFNPLALGMNKNTPEEDKFWKK